MSANRALQPAGWATPVGYANGMAAEGRIVVTGGQIGWNADQAFESDDLADQVRQTLANVVAVLAEGGAGPGHVVSMTWYLTDVGEYSARLKDVGRAYRDTMGREFPAMAVVGVTRLVEARAKVEIQAIAVVPTEE
ncbi:RidA family protein [Sphingomonas sp.]|uniref:RidA family protein n=1 Tax=Sphingomonas sp. TaxID=28214 RepID=UPI002DD65F28|nr:RidA family protein [Sphingomonas sp.]